MRGVRHVLLLLALVCGACGGDRAPAGAAPASSDPQPRPEPEPPSKAPPDAVKTASGLTFKVLAPGSGDKHPEPHDKVRVNFRAWNAKGKLSDGTQQRGGPEVFAIGGVIAGWQEALQLMRVGEKRWLWIPDRLVYPGRPGFPRANAVFELELLEIIDGVPPPAAPADVASVPADAVKTGSGLAYKLLHDAPGDEKPNAWDRVTVHYTGWTPDGEMFESSRNREQPSIFDVGEVMPGWREALLLLSAGDRARLWLPEALAIQERGGEPKGAVVFDVELLSVERRPEPPRPPEHVKAPPRDAKRTRSGLAYRIVSNGHGTRKPKPSDRVQVHYSAWARDGQLFDSSVVRGKPTTVPVSRVVPGWAEGLQLMVEGDKALFWIPEKLVYGGKDGAPRGMLVYEVELLKIAP